MLVVVNTASGALSDPNQRARLASLLPDATFVEVTNESGIEAVRRSDERIVVAAGGDGTVSAVAATLAGGDRILGVLPCGTLNHFAKDLRIPLELPAAIELLRRGIARDVDVAEVNGRIFINNASLGMYPQIVREREKIRRRGVRKWTAFTAAVVHTFWRWPLARVRLEAQGRKVRRLTPFVFVGNNRYELEGLRMGSRDRVDVGELCLCCARRMSRFALVRMAVRGLLGGIRNSGDLDVICARELWVNSRRKVSVALDGEVIRMRAPLHFRIRPGALKVIAP